MKNVELDWLNHNAKHTPQRVIDKADVDDK